MLENQKMLSVNQLAAQIKDGGDVEGEKQAELPS